MIRNLFYIVFKYGTSLSYLGLSIVCFYLIVNYNHEQRQIWLNSSNIVMGKLYEQYNNLSYFVSLKKENKKLTKEIVQLKEQVLFLQAKEWEIDTTIASSFELIPAMVINNSINRTNNTMTLNKGARDGIKKGMGVICGSGVVGIVAVVNKKYSIVFTLLNSHTRISAMIKRTKTIGDLVWKTNQPNKLNLQSVPQYVNIIVGDTVVTSSYSFIFPKGQNLGYVYKLDEDPNTGFYDIIVRMSVQLESLNHVYVVKNSLFEEIQEFQNSNE